jgi:hypothetical protein
MGEHADTTGHVRASATSILAWLAFVVLAAIAAGVLFLFRNEVDWQRTVWYQLVTGGLLAIAGGGIVAWGIATFLSVDPNPANAAPDKSPVGGKPPIKQGGGTANHREDDIAGKRPVPPPEEPPDKAAPPSGSQMAAAAALLLAGLTAGWSAAAQRHESDREIDS